MHTYPSTWSLDKIVKRLTVTLYAKTLREFFFFLYSYTEETGSSLVQPTIVLLPYPMPYS